MEPSMNLIRCVCAFLLLVLAGPVLAEGRLTVMDAWIRPAPAAMPMAAGYATLSNSGDAPLTVLAVQSDAFRMGALHDTVIENGVARMRKLHRLVIAPGETVELAPGGRHLMLMEAREDLPASGRIPVRFLLSDGRRVDTLFDIGEPDADDHVHEGHEGH